HAPQVLGLGVEASRLGVEPERSDQRLELGLGSTLAILGLDQIEEQLLAVLPDGELVCDQGVRDVCGLQSIIEISMLPGEQAAEPKQGGSSEGDTGGLIALHGRRARGPAGAAIIGGSADWCTDRTRIRRRKTP